MNVKCKIWHSEETVTVSVTRGENGNKYFLSLLLFLCCWKRALTDVYLIKYVICFQNRKSCRKQNQGNKSISEDQQSSRYDSSTELCSEEWKSSWTAYSFSEANGKSNSSGDVSTMFLQSCFLLLINVNSNLN